MSTWIDFAVYATLILLLFVLLPRNGRQFILPTIADRNPEWLGNHRDVVECLESSRWFLRACYVWAAVSIAVLLGVALDLFLAPFGAVTPKWEVLKDLNGTFVFVGVLGWGACTLLWFRWLRAHVPPAETRRATLKPRVASDYLALPWRIAVEALTALHLGAWIVIGVLGLAGGAAYWSGFVFIVAMTVMFAIVAAAVPQRRPGFADRVFGERLRRVELGAAYLLRLAPLITGGMLLSERVYGLDPDRPGNLLLVSLIIAMLLLFLRLRPVAPPSPRFDVEPRLSA
ncbi:MAG TPA: hypothetical protein VNA66_03495 [Gammaproteobacteria bacterium]|nr:hypothetical protein [Gammaproteobacteria bacterium]